MSFITRPRRYSRRALLKTLGISGAMLPMLSGQRQASASTLGTPKRFIALCMPNGHTDDYYPSGEGRDWSIADAMGQVKDDAPLKPLLAHRDEINLLAGLSIQNARDSFRAYTRDDPEREESDNIGGHACLPHMLTGALASPGPRVHDNVGLSAGHASLDQYLVETLPGYNDLPFPSLVLRPQKWRGNDQYLSFLGPCLDGETPNAPPPRDDAPGLYEELFGAAGVDAAALRRLRARRASVLDLVGGQLERFGQRVAREDRRRIEQHLGSIREVERTIDALQGACQPPENQAWDPQIDYTARFGNDHIPEILKAQMDMVVAAMACDLTRTATLLLSNSHNNNYTFPWLADKDPGFDGIIDPNKGETSAGGPGDGLRHHHSIAHAERKSPEHTRRKNYVDQWFISQFAYLLERLKTTLDPDGRPMLENTVVLFMNLQKTGPGHQTHDVPWILGGNADGYFDTGRYWRSPKRPNGETLTTTNLLTSIMKAMGVEQDHFATSAYGGEFSALKA